MCTFPVSPWRVPAQRQEPVPAAHAAPASVAYQCLPAPVPAKHVCAGASGEGPVVENGCVGEAGYMGSQPASSN